MRFLVCLSLLLAGVVNLFSQTIISGKVVSSDDAMPLPYATLRFPNLSIGFIADEEGHFRYTLPEGSEPLELVASMLGYQELSLSLEGARLSEALRFELVPQPEALDLVEVTSTRLAGLHDVTLGNKSESTRRVTGWEGSVRSGGERGVLIEPLKNEQGYLKSVNFHLVDNTYDSVRFQLILYTQGAKGEFKQRAPDDVFITTGISSGWVRYDVSDRRILFDQPFLVMLRRVEAWSDKERNSLHLSSGLFEKPMYYRENAGAPLEKLRLWGVTLQVEATFYKE